MKGRKLGTKENDKVRIESERGNRLRNAKIKRDEKKRVKWRL